MVQVERAQALPGLPAAAALFLTQLSAASAPAASPAAAAQLPRACAALAAALAPPGAAPPTDDEPLLSPRTAGGAAAEGASCAELEPPRTMCVRLALTLLFFPNSKPYHRQVLAALDTPVATPLLAQLLSLIHI